jgi:hypothetical protein
MQNNNLLGLLKAIIAVGSGALLGRRRIGIKAMNNTADNSGLVSLGQINDANLYLAEMANHTGPMAALIKALEQKGMRFDEASLDNGEIVHQDENVVIFRGAAYEVIHRAFHGDEGGVTRKKMWQNNLRLGSFSRATPYIPLMAVKLFKTSCNLCNTIIHKRSRPNEKS